MDPYSPEQWHDFFLMVGGGSAALSGLVVVAMSLRLGAIVREPPLLHRGRGALTGMAGVFTRCALVLMGGQSGRAVAIEVFAVCAFMMVSNLLSFWQVERDSQLTPRGTLYRTVGHTACYISEMIGAVLLFLGFGVGLYIVAVAMMSNFYFMISGTWLLLVGISQSESTQ